MLQPQWCLWFWFQTNYPSSDLKACAVIFIPYSSMFLYVLRLPHKYLDILGKCFSDFFSIYIFKFSSMLEVGDVGLMYLCMRTIYRSRVYFLVPQVLQSFRPRLGGGNGME